MSILDAHDPFSSPKDKKAQMDAEMAMLNEEQQAVVCHVEGPALVLAGAGTGKTRVTAVRAAYLINIEKVDPTEILIVTFTVKAVGEVKERVQEIAGPKGRRVRIGTFHSVSLKLLIDRPEVAGLKEGFEPADQERANRLMADVLRDAAAEGDGLVDFLQSQVPDHIEMKDGTLEFTSEGLKEVMSELGRAKDKGMTPVEYAQWVDDGTPSPLQQAVGVLYSRYQDKLVEANLCDFGDMILWPTKAMAADEELRAKWGGRFRHIMVDEFQDTSPVQQEWLKLMVANHYNVVCVGDDDQAIFGFRGADSSLILRFEEEYKASGYDPVVVTFRNNYRCSGIIMDAANAVIGNNKVRRTKKLEAVRDRGDLIKFVMSVEESQMLRRVALRAARALEDGKKKVFVLIRSNFMARPIEEAFVHHGLSYELVGGDGFYAREEIKDLVAWLKLLHNFEADLPAFRRVVNKPARGLGAKTVEQFEAFLQALNAETQAQDEKEEDRDVLGRLFGILQDRPDLDIRQKARTSYFTLMAHVMAYRDAGGPVGERLERFLDAIGYIGYWQENKAGDRLDNIAEYCRHASEVNDVAQLINMADRADKANSPDSPIKIMTAHRAKGLEADLVMAPFFQEGMFPTNKAIEAEREGNPLVMEDERKLAYVTITRAIEHLEIHYAGALSRFADEVPRHLVQVGEEGMGAEGDVDLDEMVDKRIKAFCATVADKGASYPDWLDVAGEEIGDWVAILADGDKMNRLRLWSTRIGLLAAFESLENAYTLSCQIEALGERVAAE